MPPFFFSEVASGAGVPASDIPSAVVDIDGVAVPDAPASPPGVCAASFCFFSAVYIASYCAFIWR